MTKSATKSTWAILIFSAAVLTLFQNCSGFLGPTGGSSIPMATSSGNSSFSTTVTKPESILTAVSATFLGAAASNPFYAAGSCIAVSSCTGSGPSDETYTLNSCSTENATISGSALISFASAGCSFGLSGGLFGQITQTVGVIPNINVDRHSGIDYAVSGTNANNYNNQSIGGGLSLYYSVSLSSQSGNLTIPGINVTGSDGSSVSVSTPSPLTLGLSDSTNILSLNGNLQIDDNTDGLTLLVGAQDLSWDVSSCLCPVNATLTGTLSGSQSGDASITFGANCGAATLTILGTTFQETLTECTP